MLNDPLHGIHRWVELIVLAVVVSTTVQWVKHPLSETLLAIGRAPQQIHDAPSSGTQELLVFFQQLRIWFTEHVTLDWQIWNQDERNLPVRERVLFHPNHGVTDPGGHKWFQSVVFVNVKESPVFISHHLFASGVCKCELIVGTDSMLTVRYNRGIFPIHPIQVFVAILLFLELCPICLKGIDNEQGIIQITATGRVDIDIQWIEDFHGGAVLDNTLLLNLCDAVLHSHSDFSCLIVVRHCFMNCRV